MKEISFEFKIPKIQFSGELKQRLKIAISIVFLALILYIGMAKYDFSLAGGLILTYFLLSLIWKLDSRISGALALFFLVCCPILLYFKNDVLAETFAVYAFYFLTITVFGLILDLRERKNPLGKGAVPRTNLALASSPSARGAGAKLVRGVDNSSGQRKRKIV